MIHQTSPLAAKMQAVMKHLYRVTSVTSSLSLRSGVSIRSCRDTPLTADSLHLDGAQAGSAAWPGPGTASKLKDPVPRG